MLSFRFPDSRLFSLDSENDSLLLWRTLTNHKINDVIYRDRRAHLLADEVSFEMTQPEVGCGTLKVTGFVRGRELDVNGIVHLPGWGDFHMLQIDSARDIYKVQLHSAKNRKPRSDSVVVSD